MLGPRPMSSLARTALIPFVSLGILLVTACSDGGGGTAAGTGGAGGTGTAKEPETCTKANAARACTAVDERAEEGKQYCYFAPGGKIDKLLWGPCVTSPACKLGQHQPCSDPEARADGLYTVCEVDENGEPNFDDTGCDTPLVLRFGSEPIEFLSPGASAQAFDLGGAGRCATPDWPTAATPWLAIDLDHDGAIDGRELFGSGTILPDGRHARNGFEALAALDSDGDGHITPADARYAELLAGSDRDGDRRASPSELVPISSLGITDIDLGYHERRECDARGNCGLERAAFRFDVAAGDTRTGEVVDVRPVCGDPR